MSTYFWISTLRGVIIGNKLSWWIFYFSKEMLPDYERLASELKPEGIVLAKIDAVKNRNLSDKQDVHGYPVLRYIV